MNLIRAILLLTASLALPACGGETVIDTPTEVGATFEINGQKFTVDSVATDGSSIVVTAAAGGFSPVDLTFTLRKSPDGGYSYSTGTTSITYNPDTKTVAWSIKSGSSVTDVVIAALESNGSSLIPGITSAASFSEGTTSSFDASTYLRDFQNEVDAVIDYINSDVSHPYYFDPGYADVDFSYANINVKGLEAAHSAGWTGEGATVRVVDWFSGSFDEYIDIGTGYELEFTHGANTGSIVGAVAPGATIIESEIDDYFKNIKAYYDTDTDVVNASFGWHITDSSSQVQGMIDAAGFVTGYLEPLAAANPNAVIVEAAGNNGGINALSINYACGTAGDRNTADTCTDIMYSLDSDYYSYLDRTIYVGSYDSVGGTLTNYSVSAGDNAKDYFIVADGNSILDTGEGTSYAAPRVAGVVALTVQKFPNLTAAERTLLVLYTADDLGVAGVDAVYGHGLLNASAALNPIGLLQ